VDEIKWGLECPVCFHVVHFELDIWWDPEIMLNPCFFLEVCEKGLHDWLGRTQVYPQDVGGGILIS
jgi:hypothetical protein